MPKQQLVCRLCSSSSVCVIKMPPEFPGAGVFYLIIGEGAQYA